MSNLIQAAHCFNNCSFKGNFEIGKRKSSNFVLFWSGFSYSRCFEFLYKFWDLLVIFCQEQKSLLNRKCIGSIDQFDWFGENDYLTNIEPSNPHRLFPHLFRSSQIFSAKFCYFKVQVLYFVNFIAKYPINFYVW